MSPTKKRQTMAKVARERELKERRALKQEKKDERRAAAAERKADPNGLMQDETTPDETAPAEPELD